MTADLYPAKDGPPSAIPLPRPAAKRPLRGAAHPAGGSLLRVSPRTIVARAGYRELDVSLDEATRAFWCYLNPTARPSFTVGMLDDLADMNRLIASLFAATPVGAQLPFDYFVLGSHSPGVFNLGGDLTLFADKIRAGDREGLRAYAQSCITAGYANYTGYGHGIVTIALIQGDALGGGLEAPLSCDLLIAERHARFGLPEILFNLFPGMGAYSYLSRRIGPIKAEEMILSGRVYTAEEMFRLGVVDVLAEEGEGERMVREHIDRYRSRFRARSMVYGLRRRVNPVPLQELRDIADLWVDAALRMSEQDLRKMARIAVAQKRANARSIERRAATRR